MCNKILGKTSPKDVKRGILCFQDISVNLSFANLIY